jgi:(2Fe-2S) ferredoxin
LLDFELYLRTFVYRPVSIHLEGRIVHEHILAGGPLDETIALRGVKPFHNTFFSHYCSPDLTGGERDVLEGQKMKKLRLYSRVAPLVIPQRTQITATNLQGIVAEKDPKSKRNFAESTPVKGVRPGA